MSAPSNKTRWVDEETHHAASKKWADEDDDVEESESNNAVIKDEAQPDGSTLRTVTEYTTNAKGQKVKIIKRIKIYKKQVKVNRNVEARRKWKKFGEVKDCPPGPEPVVTNPSQEDMFLESSRKSENKDKAVKSSKDSSISIQCRNCGRDHWTSKCPYGKQDAPVKASTGPSNVYQPPGRTGRPDSNDRGSEEVATVRVANLSEDTKESDLAELFRNFGPVSRIYLAKDKGTGSSRGFAYVNFVYREDAAKAIQKLNGYGYDHLILHLEWAKSAFHQILDQMWLINLVFDVSLSSFGSRFGRHQHKNKMQVAKVLSRCRVPAASFSGAISHSKGRIPLFPSNISIPRCQVFNHTKLRSFQPQTLSIRSYGHSHPRPKPKMDPELEAIDQKALSDPSEALSMSFKLMDRYSKQMSELDHVPGGVEEKTAFADDMTHHFVDSLGKINGIIDKSIQIDMVSPESANTLKDLLIIYRGIVAQITHMSKKYIKTTAAKHDRPAEHNARIEAAENLKYLCKTLYNYGQTILKVYNRAVLEPEAAIEAKETNVLPVTIITGFLGSGKTTLVNHILRGSHGRRIAVIENEFGQVGIDDTLIQNTKREIQKGAEAEGYQIEEDIIEMNNGCVCCSVRGDLVREKKFEHVIIETTGLAHVAPVAQTFFTVPDLVDKLRIDGIITVVDAKHAIQHIDEKKPHGEVSEAAEQIAFADRIILNKTDLVDPEELAHVERKIRSINRYAEIVHSQHSQVPLSKVIDIRSFDLDRAMDISPEILDDKHHHHHITVKSVGIVEDEALDLDKVNEWLGALLREKSEDIYRMKGVLNIAGVEDKYVFQGVHAHFTGEPLGLWGPDEKRSNKMIFIGKNLDKDALETSFRMCAADPTEIGKH
ncbi:cobalamin synthesis protein P47K [Planoprotostelium fungivorum]|uniref:Eukaryotic translation initiation factor 3 subunit G n=1 Tax=Planoprotostelium fungivorum TaxID=1890364 RepID=A0A2P6NZJ2_9EUKA|nr:cobalamin synthesis protein P47K [Planoprotostelium fungivorum]